MIQFKSNPSKSELSEIRSMVMDLTDVYTDFYLTKNNTRLFIIDNFDLLIEGLRKGDKIAFDENGLAIVVGYSDNSPRKYLKILTKDLKNVESLLKIVFWNTKEDLYCKVKNNNPIKDVLLKSGFQFLGGRGKESLLLHKAVEQKQRRTYYKEGDEE